ncbi:efflux RND transporter periplasmic adaptor subunit [Brumicola blandensis]|jgi:multidrug efflux system membrane fusion protein|uniref:Efflux RND transporter periplasmic adaptor subunit n=1 Tax=Brumicola blandensis TaxID=3075611 RepID=A0AAW8R1P3_9ALTE|nr:efflux RND transporter periplasmic adaptor subunit [Alteromonas sp. W409]MDT0582068.1 efflux RND transporter periplasmic adaptor subunit [Alteromonas sp. W409]
MKKPHIIAIAMTAIIVLWMASGMLFSAESETNSAPAKREAQAKMLVQVEDKQAQVVFLYLTVQGQVEPNRQVILRSDIKGRIAALHAEEGQSIEAGERFATLALEDREIRLERQKAQLKSRQETYKRTQTLSKDNLQSKSMLEEAYAQLKAAEADLAQIEFEIEKLEINAPFSGTVDRRMVEQGSYVTESTEIARFVDNTSLKVIAPVAQQNIQQVSIGGTAEVRLATGQVKEGKITYISPLANQGTRTFRVEIMLDNRDQSLPAGMSAEIKIPVKEVNAHFVSPAILALSTDGDIGVKITNENNEVEFHSVTIVKSETAGLWVTGLPQTARIITVGQGFVDDGTKVEIQITSAKSE